MIRPDPSTMRLPDDPDAVVPPTGIAMWLTVFIAGAMAVLAVFALLLTFATSRMADRWTADLSDTVTLRVPDGATAMALEILSQTPGVDRANPMTDAEQADLLAPWLGQRLPLDQLPIPRLIDFVPGPAFDGDGLRLRLQAELPGAVLDDHSRWRQAAVSNAERVRLLGWLALGLIAACLAALVTLAARTALVSSVRVISVLKLVGARDGYVVRAFARRFVIRALAGASLGTVLAALLLAALPGESPDAPLAGLRLQGLEWLTLIGIPITTGVITFFATRHAARRALIEFR
ncbi:MAG: cell division protein FtsX [Pseudomonadota bacterium]